MTNCREPISFTAGDTLAFTRSLRDYPATSGWSLEYEIRGGSQAIQFTSTANGSDHVILVAAATTALWLPGEYVLSGFAVLASTGERHQIYYGTLPITLNPVGSAADVKVETFKQKVLEAAECAYLELVSHSIVESDVEGTKIVRERRKYAYEVYAQAYQDRQNEIAQERARAGLPTGQKIKPRLLITTGWPAGGQFIGVGQFWPFR